MKKGKILRKLVSSALSIILSVSCVASAVSAEEYGVDISRYQGDITWGEFAKSGMSFAILRAGTTKYGIDSRFEEYYEGTRQAGVKAGAYLYVSALSLEEFKDAAEVFLEYLDGKDWEMPVYIDLEDYEQTLLGKETLTTYALAALNIISDAGYTTGIYSNKNWFTNFVDRDLIEKAGYEIWWAQYPAEMVNPLDYDKSDVCGIWQYSSHGKVQGIPYSWVDMDIAYKIYNEKKKERSSGELWMLPASTKKSFRAGAGYEYGELLPVPPNTYLNVTEKKQVCDSVWGRVNFAGYSGWCLLDGAICILADGREDVSLYYDVNLDGNIDAMDETDLRKYILSAGAEGSGVDINGDGAVNIFDCQRLRTFIISGNSSAKG